MAFGVRFFEDDCSSRYHPRTLAERTRYGAFGQCPVRRDSRVVLRFYQKDKWKNIVSIRLVEEGEPELSYEELAELRQRIRGQQCKIAEECLDDARRLLAASGLRNAVTSGNVIAFSERLAERRIPHASRIIEDYIRRERLLRRKAAQNPDPEPQDLVERGQ